MPGPAMMLRLTSGMANCDLRVAMRMSQPSASSQPPAKAYPSIAAIKGLRAPPAWMPGRAARPARRIGLSSVPT